MSAADGQTPRRGVIVTLSGRYTRFVGLMKVTLPLIAVALIVLVFNWPGIDVSSDGFRLSFADLAPDAEGNLGMTRARFAGTDRFGRPFLVTADRATQDADGFDVFALDTLQADVTLTDGTWVSITAATGVFERSAKILALGGPISIFTDVGYEIHAEQAVLDLDSGSVDSALQVRGHGPFGALWADSLRFSGDGKTLELLGGVRVVVNPATRR